VRAAEIDAIAEVLGRPVVAVRPLAGGFSHETCQLTLKGDERVVVRLGGPDPGIEAAVMNLARAHVPVPEVLCVVPTVSDETRTAMALEYVTGTLLSDVLTAAGDDTNGMAELGAEVGRVIAGIGAVTFGQPGFFTNRDLAVREMPPWSRQLPEFAATCMDVTPAERLDAATRQAWSALCTAHAPALAAIDAQARLVHADANPKNILATRAGGGWRVDAVLDWEFSFSGSPYADAANMTRFSGDYPSRFTAGFREGFADHHPASLPRPDDWAYLGRVLDMFALSDLVTRPLGHPVADQAAAQIRHWLTHSIPGQLSLLVGSSRPCHLCFTHDYGRGRIYP
jgi:aminoglycoside phosphotransferase (APT) family kinase protein